MDWIKIHDYPRIFEVTVAICLIFAIFSLYNDSVALFWLSTLVTMFILFSKKYVEHLSNHLVLPNSKQVVRLFPHEEDQLTISLRNKSRLPLLTGEVFFTLDNSSKLEGGISAKEVQSFTEYSSPVSIPGNNEYLLNLNVKGMKRGVSRISNFKTIARDFFGVITMELSYTKFIRTEIVVYPEPKPLSGLSKLIRFQSGNNVQPNSIYEDRTLKVGTRAYQLGDSIRNIDWKASAKLQYYQTKIHEKTIDTTWSILLNVTGDSQGYGRMPNANLEEHISNIAYLCKQATKQNIPFEILVNLKTAGKHAVLHLPADSGNPQLFKAYDLLARINGNGVTVGLSSFLDIASRKVDRNSTIIFFGHHGGIEESIYYSNWISRGANLYRVETSGAGSKLINWIEKRAVANE